MRLKILTLNIHKGLDWKGKIPTVVQLKKLLIELDADIIFLQEVAGKHSKNSMKYDNWIEDQFEYLCHDLWPHSIYSHHALFDGRHHGNVILSRYEILESKVIDISLNPREQRAILFAKLNTGHSIINCLCVHLNLLHRDRLKQYELIESFIKKNKNKDDKYILAGDFNDWSQKASLFLDLFEGYKKRHKKYAKTFPAPFPLLRLDRIYLSGLKPVHAEVLSNKSWKSLSDHLPIYIEVEDDI